MKREEICKILNRIDETSSIDLNDDLEYKFYKVYNGLLFIETFPLTKNHSSILRLTNRGKELIRHN